MIHSALGAAISCLAAVAIVEAPNLGARRVAVRPHKKRRNQSWAYHRRIEKKWRKRFGVIEVPAWYHGPDDRLYVNRPALEAIRAMTKGHL